MRKIKSVILAAVLAVGMIVPTAGCGGDKVCVHNVGTWETTVEPTCMTTGERKGICGECLETVTEVIPSDPNAHVYSAWDISIPSAVREGSAQKVCTKNENHVLTETLPVLGSTQYESSITQRPTPTTDGVRTYVLAHTVEDIVFTRKVNKTGVQTVLDAVELGAADESRADIRSAKGTYGWNYYENSSATNIPSHEHSYEFGDGYTHIVDGTDGCERWYYYDAAGNIVGLTNFEDSGITGKIVDDLKGSGNEQYIYGSRLYLQYANFIGYFFGVENMLGDLYQRGRENLNSDFKEDVDVTNPDVPVYKFSFGAVENSGESSQYYAIVEVEFTLNKLYSIDTISVTGTTYVNNSQQIDNSEPPKPLPAIATWYYDDNGNAVLAEGKENGARYITKIKFAQTRKSEEDVVPTNPHTDEKMYVQNFDIAHNGKILTDDDVVEFTSGASTGYIFSIKNIQPTSALNDYSFDDFRFYLRTIDKDGLPVDTPIIEGTSIDSLNALRITYYMRKSDKAFFLNSKEGGEKTIVIKTAKLERVMHCKISSSSPVRLFPVAYNYVSAEYISEQYKGGYLEETWDEMGWEQPVEPKEDLPTMDTYTISSSVYAKQPFYFNAKVPRVQESFASASYTVAINGVAVSEDDTRFMDTSIRVGGRDVPVTQFVTDKTGDYVITLKSKLDSSVYCTIYVKVTTEPPFKSWATRGTFSRELETLSATVTVTFDTPVKGMAEVEENGTTVEKEVYTVNATVEIKGMGTQVLACTYDIEANKLTSTFVSGLPDVQLVLGINEGYDFELSYWSPDFNYWETVALCVDKG